MAKLLLEKETITHDDIYDLIGPRPFAGDKLYQEYVSQRHVTDQEEQAAEEAETKGETPSTEGGGLSPGLA